MSSGAIERHDIFSQNRSLLSPVADIPQCTRWSAKARRRREQVQRNGGSMRSSQNHPD
jgi:hypothetical protein